MKRLITVLFIFTLFMPLVVQAAGTYPINYRNVSNPRSLTDLLLDRFGYLSTVTNAVGPQLKGTVYYVDGNKSTAGTGLGGWGNAFNTLSAAMAASHANIAVSSRRAWASRNTIYVRADGITEDLTTLAQKTDIIGVGSNDAYEKALITGTWIVPSTTAYIGCHFYNMQFTDAGATPIFDLDGQAGVEFHGCLFDASAATTGGILASECSYMRIDGCEFTAVTASQEFDTYAIKIEDDTNAIYNVYIENNTIRTAGIGLDFDETGAVGCWARNNYLFTGGMGIDSEDIVGLMVVGNRHITTLGEADDTSNDFNILYAVDNIVTGGTGTLYIPSPADF